MSFCALPSLFGASQLTVRQPQWLSSSLFCNSHWISTISATSFAVSVTSPARITNSMSMSVSVGMSVSSLSKSHPRWSKSNIGFIYRNSNATNGDDKVQATGPIFSYIRPCNVGRMRRMKGTAGIRAVVVTGVMVRGWHGARQVRLRLISGFRASAKPSQQLRIDAVPGHAGTCKPTFRNPPVRNSVGSANSWDLARTRARMRALSTPHDTARAEQFAAAIIPQ